MSAGEPGYLLLAGTTKAATTSLFAWLAAHPRVAPARIKEPRYFLDPDYPLEPSVPHARGFAAYAASFEERGPGALRLEATPDYLHSPGSAARIRAELARVKLVFSLRDPLTRLVSWYRYARAEGRLDPRESFEAWIRRQQRAPHGAQHDRALAQGRYTADLARYYERFERSELLVLFHEELERDARSAVHAVCAFAGLEAGFYDDFAFEARNRTAGHRYPRLQRAYHRLAFETRRRTVRVPALHALLRRVHRSVSPLYRRWNAASEAPVEIPTELEHELVEFHAADVRALQALLGRAVPWPRFASLAREWPRAV